MTGWTAAGPFHILAIDPGPTMSAWVVYDPAEKRIVWHAKQDNEQFLHEELGVFADNCHSLAIEMIASYGMAVGADVFETCVWIGRYHQRWLDNGTVAPVQRVFRRDVKMHLCGSARAKDANIRAALIDRFGPGKEKAIGTKKAPGPLYGVKADVWAALAVAITFAERRPVG